jgi:hypothetical protein
MDSETFKTCVLCKKNFTGFGNNPTPISNKGLCCNRCNLEVLKERFKKYNDNNFFLNTPDWQSSKNNSNTPNNTPNILKKKTINKTSELSAQNHHESNVCVDI